MSDADKNTVPTGKGISLEDLERDIAASSKNPPPPPPPTATATPAGGMSADKPVPPPRPPARSGGGLLGGTALLVALGALGLSGYGYWRDHMAAPPPVAADDGADLSPLTDRVAALETRQQDLGEMLDALSRRQDSLEARLAAGTAPGTAPAAAPTSAEQPATPAEPQVTPSEPSVSLAEPVAPPRDEELAARVSALEAREPETPETVDLEPLTRRVTALETVATEMIPRVTMLETRRQMGAVGEALIIAVGQLQAALTAGRPYARELRAAQALAANDTALLDLLAPLEQTAEKGLAGDIELRERFRLLAPEVLRADRDREGAPWTDRVLGRLSSIVTLRSTSGDVAGDHADAVLARAEAALIAGDLPRAVEEMEKLPAHAAAPAAEWMKLAEARMAAEAAAATLADLSLARMTGTEAR
ncbi:COG4223 family protein [Niveispirillum fermenti]|uniref:COG4223 family protein n=1 Tax=Niveispirillum fermenti TaxID=1233113 RepID=UPI003A89DC11